MAVVCVLAGAEAVWRLALPETQGERDSKEYVRQALRYLTPCAAVEERAGARALVGLRVLNTGGAFTYPLEKAAGVRRIVFVGESTGVNLAGAAWNLLQHGPDRASWQLMGCAESGSNLEHVEGQTAEALEYSPDVLVITFGHNWAMAPMPLDERSLRTQALLLRSRLISGIGHLLTRREPYVPPDPADQLARLEAYLRQMARRARERGVAVVLTTLTPNLWVPPLVEEPVLWDAEFLQTLLLYTRGDAASALERIESLIERKPHPYWHFLAGVWLTRGGEPARGAEQLQLAVDTEAMERDRATSKVNDLIRRVAKEEGVGLRDTDREMRAIARNGAPGWEVMRDHCHLQPSYLSDEAEALIEMAAVALGEQRPRLGANPFAHDRAESWMLEGIAGVQTQVRDARARRYQRGMSYMVEQWTRSDRQRLMEAVNGFLDGNVFAALRPAERVAVLVAIADGYEWAGAREEALEMNRRAREVADAIAPLAVADVAATSARPRTLAPAGSFYDRASEAGAWIQLGLIEVAGSDPDAAAAAFRHALRIAPMRADAAFLLAEVDAQGAER